MEDRRGFGRSSGDGERRLPPVRTRWLLVLTGLLLLSAVVALHVGLDKLRSLQDPGLPPEAPAGLVEDERLQRQLRVALAGIDRAHPRALAATAVGHVALSLVLFFAVASIVMRDPRSRRAAVVAAWTGIAFHVANTLLFLLVLRE